MIDIVCIKELADVAAHRHDPDFLGECLRHTDRRYVDAVADYILHWMWSRAHGIRTGPLEWEHGTELLACARTLISCVPGLGKVLTVSGNTVGYNSTVSVEDRALIERYVREHYKPLFRV